MRKSIPKVWLSISLVMGMAGCAEIIQEREGAQLQLVPITNTYQLTIKPKKDQQAWQQVQDYVEQHWDVLSVEAIDINWFSRRGKKLADKLVSQLKKKGIGAEMIDLNRVANGGSGHFDLSISTTKYKVITEVCDYVQVGHFGAYPEGCYTENARWQSMVHPEKMLLTSDLDK